MSIHLLGVIRLTLLSSTGSYNRKDSEAASAQARLKELEAQLNSKDAQLATAVSEKRSLEVSVADLQEQMQEVFLCATKFSSFALWLLCVPCWSHFCVCFCDSSWM